MVLDGVICYHPVIHCGRVILYVWSRPPVVINLSLTSTLLYLRVLSSPGVHRRFRVSPLCYSINNTFFISSLQDSHPFFPLARVYQQVGRGKGFKKKKMNVSNKAPEHSPSGGMSKCLGGNNGCRDESFLGFCRDIL